MWCVALIFFAVASCSAELFELKMKDLPVTTENRIIGGSATTIQQYPYTVQVIFASRFVCGGSLLTTRHVLSAGHCFVDNDGYLLKVSLYNIRVGSTTLNSGGSLYQVSAIIVHESYNLPVRDNDVAVVLMSTPVDLNNTVAQLAYLAYPNTVVPDNAYVTAVGWGLTHVDNGGPSNVLNEVTVRKINAFTCRNRYLALQASTGKPFPVTSNMICAGLLDVGGKDACQGDSGGPLIYEGVVVGITSWGAGCAQPLYPGVSARVSSYINWIDHTVQMYSAGSLSSKVGVVTLLTPVLFLILSV